MVQVPAEDRQRPFLRARVVGEYGVVWGWEEKLQVVPQARVHGGGHAGLVEYPAWACVAGPLCGLEADCGNLPDLWRVVVGHAVKEEGSVSGEGRFHLVPYGVPIVGPCCLDGAGGMEVGQPPCAVHALVTARVAGWREVVGRVRWSAWKPMEAVKTPVR